MLVNRTEQYVTRKHNGYRVTIAPRTLSIQVLQDDLNRLNAEFELNGDYNKHLERLIRQKQKALDRLL